MRSQSLESWGRPMSYLDTPRVHFLGAFFAEPSTINNDPSNDSLPPPLDLSRNPDGPAFFRFLDCAASSVVGPDGAVSLPDGGDPLARATVSTVEAPLPRVAKIVDLN